MLWIDVKYASILALKLDRYILKSRSPYLANFNCHYCDDERRRGYLIEKNGIDSILYYCHKCNKSTTLAKVLSEIDPSSYSEYRIEKLKGSVREEPIKNKKRDVKPLFVKIDGLTKISSLQNDHPAKAYVVKRKIPFEQHFRMFYTPKYMHWVNTVLPKKFPETALKYDEPRLVIPFFDSSGRMFAAQGRSLKEKSSLRYITVVFDETMPRIFGIDKYNPTKDVFIVEGPIDSLFAPNCVALAGGDNSDIERVVTKKNAVFVFDNEPRNPDTIRRIDKAIDDGYRVFIFPEKIKSKDLNDMVIKEGYSLEEISVILHNNQYFGLAAKARLSEWNRL